MLGVIAVRDVVEDNHGRVGVVVCEEPYPGRAWIREQQDERVRAMGRDERWLGVLPLRGGMVIVPESLATRLREATADDIRAAVDGGNMHAARTLAELFPVVTALIARGR